MNIRHRIFVSSIGFVASLCLATTALATGTLVRWNKMGEADGGSNGAPVSFTADSVDLNMDQTLGLSGVNSPVFRTISGRPDGGTGLGIEFSAASQQYLVGLSLNWPQESPLSDHHGGGLDLDGIDDRAMQFWVSPTSTAAQSIVMDTDMHGVRIDSNGKFAMRYVNVDYESNLSVVPNTWYHIEVVRPSGPDSGSLMYINGNAVAVAMPPYDYHSDTTTPLTVGSNTAGTGEFFTGIVDDFRESIFGSSASTNFGTFNYVTDNAYVASPVVGLKNVAGDVNNDGSLTQADKDAFIAGWLHKHVVNGFQIGDMSSRAQGDLNLDGITDIQDLVLIQHALTGSGLGTISSSQLSSVPEPSTLALLALCPWLVCSRRARYHGTT